MASAAADVTTLGLGTLAEPAAEAISESAGTLIAEEAGSLSLGGSSRVLGRNLERAGFERMVGDEAHHIVATGAARAAPARNVLARFGIDIDSAENGVFLPRSFHCALTQDYYHAVNDMLTAANTRGQALEVLQSVRAALLTRLEP